MEKWADYLISAVFKDGNGVITDLWIHTDTGNHVAGDGHKITVAEGIAMREAGTTFCTITWNYNRGDHWTRGSLVDIVERADGTKYLRSEPDERAADNLDNLLRLNWLVS